MMMLLMKRYAVKKQCAVQTQSIVIWCLQIVAQLRPYFCHPAGASLLFVFCIAVRGMARCDRDLNDQGIGSYPIRLCLSV